MSDFKPVNQPITPTSADPGEEFPFLHTITVVDRVVSVDKPELVQNNIRTETVTLNLDSEWDGLSCIINIGSGKTPTSLIWSGQPVIIPAELMTDIGTLNVSVVGYGDNGTVRAVTKKADAMFVVAASGYVHDDNPVPDPTTILGQLVEAADRANQAAQNAEDSTIDKVSVTMLPTGSGASGSVADKTLSLRIPNGPQGPQGPKGDPGDLTTVAHDSTLTGDGTSGTPLGVSDTIARKSDLEQKINSFKATVSETYTTKDEFNALEIGGTNLLPNTGSSKGYGTIAGFGNLTVGTDDVRGEYYRRATTGTSEVYISSNRTTGIDDGEYTVSFWYRANQYVKSVDVYWLARSVDSSADSDMAKRVEVGLNPQDNTWTYWSSTFTAISGMPNGYIRIDNNGSSTSGQTATLDVTQLKLERGNKPTAWSPAPEDFDGKYTSKTEFKQTLSNYVPLSTYQTLEARVQALEAKLSNQ